VTTAHSTVVVVADDGTSPVGTDEWNAAHTGIVDTQSRPTIDQTIRANYSARIDGMPLVIPSGFAVIIDAGGLLVLAP
jgi:hypothetical protein